MKTKSAIETPKMPLKKEIGIKFTNKQQKAMEDKIKKDIAKLMKDHENLEKDMKD